MLVAGRRLTFSRHVRDAGGGVLIGWRIRPSDIQPVEVLADLVNGHSQRHRRFYSLPTLQERGGLLKQKFSNFVGHACSRYVESMRRESRPLGIIRRGIRLPRRTAAFVAKCGKSYSPA